MTNVDASHLQVSDRVVPGTAGDPDQMAEILSAEKGQGRTGHAIPSDNLE